MYGKIKITNMMRIKTLNYFSLSSTKNTFNVSDRKLWVYFVAS
jgi:hypothetical protein